MMANALVDSSRLALEIVRGDLRNISLKDRTVHSATLSASYNYSFYKLAMPK